MVVQPVKHMPHAGGSGGGPDGIEQGQKSKGARQGKQKAEQGGKALEIFAVAG